MISEVCICNIASGAVEVLLRHEGHIEAPNWHPEGYLLVNGGGELYRLPLADPALHRVPIEGLQRLNNDHGISPDGKTLVLSDSPGYSTSIIHLCPVEGGTPTRVTPKAPSWWHGWSPDGQRLAYVGARDGGPVLPYTCALDGSDEQLLVGGFDHVDGPDYTPDGGWIWFNGERSGQVDLWRIRPDGSDLQRMTEGQTVDWFPHPSPDGRHVLWLAYPEGTKGHPANLEVALCLMSAEGGPGRELTRLRGGQGTINVPCWAPDSRRFAFVRYPA